MQVAILVTSQELDTLDGPLMEGKQTGTLTLTQTRSTEWRWCITALSTTTTSSSEAIPNQTDSVHFFPYSDSPFVIPLRRALLAKGVKFSSDTDTEVIAQLIGQELDKGLDTKTAVKNAMTK